MGERAAQQAARREGERHDADAVTADDRSAPRSSTRRRGRLFGRVRAALRTMRPPQLSWPLRLLCAPAAVALAALVEWVLVPQHSIAPFAFTYFGVAVAAWLGGRLAGALAIVLAALVADYVFLEPTFEWAMTSSSLLAIVVFVLGATPVALLCAALRDAVIETTRGAEALRRSADLMRLSHDAILVWRRGGMIESWNRGAEDLYGYAASEAEGHVSHDLLATVFPSSLAAVEAALRQEGRWEGTLRHRTKDGHAVTVAARLQLVHGHDGVDRVLETNQDVTALVTAEQAQRESETRLRVLWESGVVGVMYANARGQIHDANDELLRMIGYTRADLEAGRLRWTELTPPEHREADARGVAELRELGASRLYEKVFIAKDGRRVPILIRYAQTGAPGGDEGVVIVVDLTERERAARARAEVEARLRAIVETAADAIITIDERGVVDGFNAAAERVFAYRADEVVGRNVRVLMPEPFRSEHDGCLARYQQTGERRIIGKGREVKGRRKDGTVFPAELAVSETIVGDQRSYTGIVRDITDRKRIEEEREHLLESERAARTEAERAARTRDEFVATLSHELRTPLNAILGWTGMLRKGTLDSASTGRALEVVERNARVQAQLVEDLLDMSRILSGKLRFDVRRVDLGAVVENALATVLPAAQAKEVRVDKLVDSGVGAVQGDPSRLEQVASNLLTNAVKFTPRGGRVHVVLRRNGSRAELVVHDTGQGIEPELLPHVFDRFRQGDSSITRKHAGLGLGLALVKHLVEQHGGDVRAESDGEGRGATFVVSLPIAAATRSPHEGPTPLDACDSLSGVKVLVVDDEPDARELVRRILEDCDAEVVAVGSAVEAIHELPEFRPNVLVSDIGMPELDGYHLMRAVRELSPEQGGRTPAVALTAFARPEDRLKALRVGYQMHLAKPIDQAELIVVVANLAGRAVA